MTAVDSLAFRIRGMDCAEEIATLRAELARLQGVRELGFALLDRKTTLNALRLLDPGRIPSR